MTRHLACRFVFSLILAGLNRSSIFCQSEPIVVHQPGSQTVEESLHNSGFEDNPSDLLRALNDVNPIVRSLAISKLIEDRDPSVVPALEKRLSSEKDVIVHIDLAAALVSIGQSSALQILVSSCSDEKASSEERVHATYDLIFMRLPYKMCTKSIVRLATQSKYGPDAKRAFPLLRYFVRDLDTNGRQNLNKFIEERLQDKEAANRIEAARTLIEIRDPMAEILIAKAQAEEIDPVVKKALELVRESSGQAVANTL